MRDRPGQKSKLLPQYHLFFNKSQQFLPTAINCWTLSAIAGNSQLLSAICNNTQTQLRQFAAIGCNSSSYYFGNSILLDSPIFSPSKTLPRYSTIVNICQQSPSLQPSPGPNNIQQLLTISQVLGPRPNTCFARELGGRSSAAHGTRALTKQDYDLTCILARDSRSSHGTRT